MGGKETEGVEVIKEGGDQIKERKVKEECSEEEREEEEEGAGARR